MNSSILSAAAAACCSDADQGTLVFLIGEQNFEAAIDDQRKDDDGHQQ
jgi:hypothetical protein